MTTFTIRSLGRVVTYDPDIVLGDLLKANPWVKELRLNDDNKLLHAVVRHLYDDTSGLTVYDPEGELQGLRCGCHVNTIIIQAWLGLQQGEQENRRRA